MKIIQINCVYEFSSTGRATQEMHEYCKTNGIESFVFCMNKSDEAHHVYYVGTHCEHKLHALWSRIFGKQGFFSKDATRKMVAQLKAIEPDVVFLGNLHANFVNLPILLKYLAENNVPTILILHDCWFFTGHCTHYTAVQCYKWQLECKDCNLMKLDNPSLFFDTSRWMFRKKKELFDAIPRLGVLGVSDWITNEARKSVILQNAKFFRRIYNWIDLDKFYPRDTTRLQGLLNIKDEFIVLGVAQGWSWRKGLSHFVEAAKRLPMIRFFIIGSFENEEDRKKMPLNIYAPGPIVNLEELAEYYSLADTLLVCSVQETFGKVSAEALACGTPVIANNATANPEIAGIECGISIENNDDDQIEAAIRKIMKEGKASYGNKCVKRACLNFEKDNQLRKYIEVSKQLIQYKKNV